MIPLRIGIEGFLCYRGYQEIDLADLGLCMLSGPNGSGKSTVFDAVTFALFGAHRGGEQRFEELINKRCDRASVEFDFLLNGGRYRAYRTVKRKTKGGSQSTVELREWSPAEAEWVVVSETNSARGFANWVAENLGLGYETFSCSMLLRQGHADRLLLAGPKDRFQVLAGIVDLGRYQRLAQKAEDRRKSAEATAEALRAQLAGVAEVSAEQLQEADRCAEAAAIAAREADQAVCQLQATHGRAAQWAQLTLKLEEAHRNRQGLADLLARGAQIEADWSRLCALHAIVPVLNEIHEHRARLETSIAAVVELTREREAKQQEVAAIAGKLGAVQEAIHALQREIEEADRAERDAAERATKLEATLSIARRQAAQQRQLEELRKELATLPADTAGAVAVARQERDRLAAIQSALAALRRLAEHRITHAALHARLPAAHAERQAAQVELATLVADKAALSQNFAAAETALRAVEQRDHQAQTLVEVAEQALRKLDQLDSAAQCPTCGQSLTAEHREVERRRRREELRLRNDAREVIAAERKSIAQKLADLNSRQVHFDERHRTLLAKTQACDAAIQQLHGDIQRAADECRRAHDELCEPFRSRAGPILGSAWPAEKDLAALASEAAGIAEARRRADAAERTYARWQQLDAAIRALAAAAGGPQADTTDLTAIQAEFDAAGHQHRRLQQALQQRRAESIEKQNESKRSSDLAANLNEAIEALNRQRDQQAAAQEHLRGQIERLTGQVPQDFPHDDVIKLERELLALEQSGTQRACEGVQRARGELATLDKRTVEIEQEIASIPVESRRPPEELALELDQAQQRKRKHQNEHLAAERRRATMEAEFERLKTVREQFREADKRRHLYKRLASLLGRDGLQRELVRRAERGIVQCANSILDRLSGGDLSLNLRDTDDDPADHALELEALHRQTGLDCPIDVAFLSGSQRFRVAVALALAIGRYASGGSRVGESVIIDEGFGSLDAEGQQVMIQELQRLKGIMQRIVLVSHQESFASSFSEGYKFVLEDGETRVSRLP